MHASEWGTELVREMTICACEAITESHGSSVQNGQVVLTQSRLTQTYFYRHASLCQLWFLCSGAFFIIGLFLNSHFFRLHLCHGIIFRSICVTAYIHLLLTSWWASRSDSFYYNYYYWTCTTPQTHDCWMLTYPALLCFKAFQMINI